MGRVRSALRAYAMLDVSPEQVLDLVDRKVNHFEIGTMVTVACAVMLPPYDTMTFALAGHPPPVIACPDREAMLAPADVGLPLGTASHKPRSSTSLAVPPESVVAFYTDGLVERRDESIDVGLERLCAAVSPGSAELVARGIMHNLVGNSVVNDDIALVVIRRTARSAG